MRSLKELCQAEMPGKKRISVKALAEKYKVNTILGLIAAHDIEITYQRQLMGNLGLLGKPTGVTSPREDGTFSREFELGFIVKPLGNSCKAFTRYEVDVQIAGIRCFATDDPGGTDETYVVATLVNINPNKGEDQHVVTKLFGPFEVKAKQTFCKAFTLGEAVIPAGTGLRVHLALFDEEGGNEEEVRKEVEEYIREAVKSGAVAIATAVGAGDVNTASTVAGDVLNSKVGRALTLGLSHFVADIWADDFLGEKNYVINASDIQRVSAKDAFDGSVVRNDPELDPDVSYNFPVDPKHPAWMFDDPGMYRAYLLVTAAESIKPCL